MDKSSQPQQSKPASIAANVSPEREAELQRLFRIVLKQYGPLLTGATK